MANVVIRIAKRATNQRIKRILDRTMKCQPLRQGKNIRIQVVSPKDNHFYSGSMRPGENKGKINI